MLKFFTKIIQIDYPSTSEDNAKHYYNKFNEWKDLNSYEELEYYYKNTKPTKILEDINYFLIRVYIPF